MYEVMDAHAVTVILVIGTLMATPVYALATYVFSGASRTKGMQIGIAFLVFGSLMSWVCLSSTPARLGPIGNLIVPVAWILPSAILYWRRDWFLSQRLSQKWLVGFQVFRALGGVFLIEMVRGNLPEVLAYPAGVGDLLVAAVAVTVLIRFRRKQRIPGAAALVVVVVGLLDFVSAFFFSFASLATPFQLFFPAVANRIIVFPTGVVVSFLVPYAIFFHTLSALTYARYDRSSREA